MSALQVQLEPHRIDTSALPTGPASRPNLHPIATSRARDQTATTFGLNRNRTLGWARRCLMAALQRVEGQRSALRNRFSSPNVILK